MVRDIIDKYFDRDGTLIRENANEGFGICSLKSHISREMLKKHTLSYCVGKDEHTNGRIHIHDLGGSLYSAYCCGHDLKELMMQGLGLPNSISSRPAKHFGSLCDQMVNYMQILSNEWEGAQAFTDVDVLLAPYIYEDAVAEKIVYYEDVKQEVQSLIYGLNFESRQSQQTPFTNFTLRINVPDAMKDQPAIMGGVPRDYTYGEIEYFMDMFNTAYFEVLLEGDRYGRPFTFPIPTITVDSDYIFTADDPAPNKLWELTAKFGLPYFSNYLGSGGNPEDIRSMCCRLRLDMKDIKATGIWDKGVKTGSLGVCTINLNRCGIEADDVHHYKQILRERVNVCAMQLKERKDHVIQSFYELGLMPYSKQYVGKLESFFLTIGVVGCWEGYVNFNPNMPFTEFAEMTLNTIKEEMITLPAKTGWRLWNLEQTPAEGCAHRLAELDKSLYPDCYVSGEAGGHYLTNSTHLPVIYSEDLPQVLKHHDIVDKMYTGGTLLNIYVKEKASPDSVRDLMHRLCKDTTIPYMAFTPTFSVCKTHGTMYDDVELCPECDDIVDTYSRVVGYYRPVRKFNNGQLNQFKNRTYVNMDM